MARAEDHGLASARAEHMRPPTRAESSPRRRAVAKKTTFLVVTAPHKKKSTNSKLKDHEAATLAAAKGTRVVVVPVTTASAKGVSAGALVHEGSNYYHFGTARCVLDDVCRLMLSHC